jgi:hypothetical protein
MNPDVVFFLTGAALMPEVFADPSLASCYTCFRDPESKNLNGFLLISFARDARGAVRTNGEG